MRMKMTMGILVMRNRRHGRSIHHKAEWEGSHTSRQHRRDYKALVDLSLRRHRRPRPV